jgi:hypothetical protein
MTPRSIPASKIAINPIIINDTHRQSREHRCPLDEHALVERLKEWELEAHLHDCDKCIHDSEEMHYMTCPCECMGEEKAYRRVIDLIQNGRVRQQHRELARK